MKKTILALTIASSVVLLTGCNEEDDVVKYYGADIDSQTEANEYAGHVRMMNELIIEGALAHCINNDHTIKNSTCTLQSTEKQSGVHDTFHLRGEVKLTKENNSIIITTNNGNIIKLRNENKGRSDLTATFTNDSGNHHKISFKYSDDTVSFGGQYQDRHGDQFQSDSLSKNNFTYDTSAYKFSIQHGKATLEGKKDTPSWTWTIASNGKVESTRQP